MGFDLEEDLPDYPSQAGLEFLEGFVFPFELFGMVVASDLQKQSLPCTNVALSQLDPLGSRQFPQQHQSFVIEFGVGGIGDILLLYGRIDDSGFKPYS